MLNRACSGLERGAGRGEGVAGNHTRRGGGEAIILAVGAGGEGGGKNIWPWLWGGQQFSRWGRGEGNGSNSHRDGGGGAEVRASILGWVEEAKINIRSGFG